MAWHAQVPVGGDMSFKWQVEQFFHFGHLFLILYFITSQAGQRRSTSAVSASAPLGIHIVWWGGSPMDHRRFHMLRQLSEERNQEEKPGASDLYEQVAHTFSSYCPLYF
jgi:hypothetical protein